MAQVIEMAIRLKRSLRGWLYGQLGPEGYLALVSRVYLWLVRRGLVEKQYPELFFLSRLVRPGAYCIDIGANLGYYSVQLSRLSGKAGRVWAVEPVPLFRKVLRRNLERSGGDNVTVLPYALGAERGVVQMGTPEIAGVFRHGCTQILSSDEATYARVYDVEMRRPDELFEDLERLDFVKCDVEGYEAALFPHFTDVLARHQPVVQVEISTTENKQSMRRLMERLGYRMYVLCGGRLELLREEEMLLSEGGDYYFLPDCDGTGAAAKSGS